MKTKFWPWYFRNTWWLITFCVFVGTVHTIIQYDPFWAHVVNGFLLMIIAGSLVGSWIEFNKHYRK